MEPVEKMVPSRVTWNVWVFRSVEVLRHHRRSPSTRRGRGMCCRETAFRLLLVWHLIESPIDVAWNPLQKHSDIRSS
jgi:hypothetical protein